MNAMAPQALLSKISDPDLRAFADRRGPSTVPRGASAPQQSVIVEVDVPISKVAPSRSSLRHTRSSIPPTPPKVSLGEAEMDQVERSLAKLMLAVSPVRLDSASAFIVTVDPERLREIEEMPLVQAIRPNRQHSAR